MMKKVLMVIAPKDFRDEEFEEPYTILKEHNVAVTVASTTPQPAKGMLGLIVKPDKALKDVNMKNYDALVFVGGSGAKTYFDDATCHTLAKTASEQKKLVSAICIAPSILANAGLLKDKTVTCWESEAQNMKSKGAHYTGKPVEEDGLTITGVGPQAAKEFGEAILRNLTKHR
ncbi:MAG: DJ-1/PfpI family protein [Deltaproteobacteria bacterium]|nr:DJ-1/PfpI family protein [Deltaproteobacteria bacterium]